MTRTVRIASGLGFYGDSWEPVAASVERGKVPEVLGQILPKHTLEDVSVEDAPLEDVIAEVFAQANEESQM